MSELPNGWLRPMISEVAEVNPRKEVHVSPNDLVSFVPMAAVDEVSGKIRSALDRPYREVSKGFTHFRDNDVIFAKITPSMENGKSAVAQNLLNGTGMGSTEFHVFRSNGAIEPEFLWRFIRQKSFREAAQTVMSGAVGQQRVPAEYLRDHLIPLPPVAEQKRIVAKVDGLTARTARARKELDRIPTFIARYKQRLLALAYSGIEAEDSITLGELAERITKGESPKWQGFEYLEQGILFLRSQNVGWGRLLLNDKVFLDPAFNLKREKSTLQSGDVLLNIVGASVGRTAIATEEIAGANCNQAVAIIRLKQRDSSDQSYVCWWLQSPEAQMVINEGVVDVARANFSLASIRAMSLPWPSKSLRAEIVRRIETAFAWLDRLAVEHTSATKLLPKLDAAILAKAFRGELVAQDPNDEPASVLLERVKGEREFPQAKHRQNVKA
ncbi:MAG TPA: type I restriction endonuclease subunit S [Hyphomonadaceae bacterium]|nr:hypothetical protein AEM38_00060 [Hyphomonadaceae bacterium UKL13-1]HCP64772.1 type I restriction endonuclease subunit S [Hyphomonadaceae bacterium]